MVLSILETVISRTVTPEEPGLANLIFFCLYWDIVSVWEMCGGFLTWLTAMAEVNKQMNLAEVNIQMNLAEINKQMNLAEVNKQNEFGRGKQTSKFGRGKQTNKFGRGKQTNEFVRGKQTNELSQLREYLELFVAYLFKFPYDCDIFL